MKEFKVFHEEYLGDDCKIIMAYDHETAAECYVEEVYDPGDYTCLGGTPVVVEVEGPDFVRKKFRVTGETVPLYSAWEIEE